MKIYTVKEAADKLKVSYRKMLRLIKEGDLEAKKIGKSYRITDNQLRRFLEGTGQEAKQDTTQDTKKAQQSTQETTQYTQDTQDTQGQDDPEDDPDPEVTDLDDDTEDIKEKAREVIDGLEVVDGQTTIDDQEYITTAKAAEIAEVSRRTIQNKLNKGSIKGKKDGRKWLAVKSSVKEYAESN